MEERKAQGLMKFTLSILSKEAQSSNYTDARAGLIRGELSFKQRPSFTLHHYEIVRTIRIKELGQASKVSRHSSRVTSAALSLKGTCKFVLPLPFESAVVTSVITADLKLQ
ncbi:hypothetical protein Tco_1375811 [Tanacetum coccineum]|uniref:Uncharacterized protein n=1 Tax=Tanacetum coccineum TaxID=301880 RepID=A0ABQ5AWN4_9ASTR